MSRTMSFRIRQGGRGFPSSSYFLSHFFTYTFKIFQDEILLKGGNLEERLEIAIRVRLGEKRVLQQIERDFKERQLKLDAFEYYHERRFKELGLVGQRGEMYCQPKDPISSV